MNDNDIVKALECCKGMLMCDRCPYRGKCGKLTWDALELIKRQQKEIEEKSNKLREILPIVAELKSEAIKEFAEKLISMCDAPHWCVWMSEIEMLMEEMTEGGE